MAEDRGALLAAVKFVEGVANGWTVRELVEWFAEDLVGPGRMLPVATVYEAVVGAIALDPATSAAAARVASLDDLPKLLAISRSRVVVTLRAFIAKPPDDRFLHTAIFNERVQRVKVERGAVWVARPAEKDLLSDIVLSLFAADILMHREYHEQSMCVCETCGRVSFTVAAPRTSCPEHPVRTDTQSARAAMRQSGQITAASADETPRPRTKPFGER